MVKYYENDILIYKSKAFIDYEGTLIEITYNEFTSETGIENITKQRKRLPLGSLFITWPQKSV